MNAKLKCDEPGCGWAKAIDFQDVLSWRGVACPSCGKGEIINTSDVQAWHMISALQSLDNALDPEGHGPKVEVVIDTAPMRKAAL